MPAGVTKDEVIISPEAQAEENIRSPDMAAFPSPFLSSGCLLCMQKPTLPPTTVARNVPVESIPVPAPCL